MKSLTAMTSLALAVTLSACSGGGSENQMAETDVASTPASQPSAAVSAPADIAGTDSFWKNATIYFMLTDRFNNGNPENDNAYGRGDDAAHLRGFMGGDLQGVIDKLESNYFTDLGVDAIWMTPIIENVHGYDEGDKRTYAYHGYWPKDWTTVDKNLGSEADLARMVEVAHAKGVRVLLDTIINHTGPVTNLEPLWPTEWVRNNPQCDWSNFAGNVTCTLTNNLPDILTESEVAVELPKSLTDKWAAEGRLEQETAELDAYFQRTGYPRAPKYYIIKWLTDWVRDYGIDGFRVDTVKHVEPEVWAALKQEASQAFADWKAANPDKVLDDRNFFMVGEVYHYGINNFAQSQGRAYNFGDRQVDFFNHGFDSLINMSFAQDASQSAEEIFSSYSDTLNAGELAGVGILNYLGSHDDHGSFDRERQQTRSAATKLMLAPGAAQIYYGDELARPMIDEQAYGDASMRTFMNWDDLDSGAASDILAHWQKLGQFRKAHPAVGAGVHAKLADAPYTFSRTLSGENAVVVALDLLAGEKVLSVEGVFADGTTVTDHYSGKDAVVEGGKLTLDTQFDLVLLAEKDQ